jgi:hypothetical protein
MRIFQDGDASCAERSLIRLFWRIAGRRGGGEIETKGENAVPDETRRDRE